MPWRWTKIGPLFKGIKKTPAELAFNGGVRLITSGLPGI
ncbi:hypothetical protein FB99_35890 [Pantoea agglomerans]|nr:hypothetical protein FB99_35890 [Pantoea agglomerans]